MNIALSITICILLFIYINYILEDFTSQETTTSAQKPSVKYFELNNEAQNLVNNYKYEKQLREIANEEKQMRDNVRKIVNHAENVIDFTELNKEYLDNVLVKNSEKDSD
jgi:hypothetical protein